MKAFFILFGLAVACEAVQNPGLKVKWSPKFGDGFRAMPETKDDAIKVGYKPLRSPVKYLSSLELLYNPQDPTISIYYQGDTGIRCGLNICLRKDDMTQVVFDMTEQGWTDYVIDRDDGTSTEFWCIQQFYCSPEYLQKPAAERIASYNSSKFFQEDTLWLTGYDGVIERVPIDQNEIENNTPFTKQACIPSMGHHYFHSMTKSTECKKKRLYSWFLLTNLKKLVGCGVTLCAEMSAEAERWIEKPGALAVKTIVPRGPECLYNMGNGIVTMHIYFVDAPLFLGCLVS